MGHIKFEADSLFDGYQLLNGKVLITDDEGIILDIVPTIDAGDEVRRMNGIITPGFINCHCHLELSHMKGLIDEGTGLVNFVFQVVSQRHFPDEEILNAIILAEDEMLKNGIVAVGDICNNTLTVAQKSKGRIYYHNFIETSGFNPSIVAQRFQKSVDFFNTYAAQYAIPIESNSIAPHAPYSVADELWKKIIHFPGNRLLTIHNQEMLAENEWFMDKKGELISLYERMNIDTEFFHATGKSSLQSYLSKFLHNQQLILVHNVHTSKDDIVFSKQMKNARLLYWCLCPNANDYISRSLPPVELLMNQNCNIVIGTDSLASNHQLSVLEELKTLHHRFPFISIETLLKWGTSNGAQALQLDNLLGSFEKGKKPGIVLCSPDLSSSSRIL